MLIYEKRTIHFSGELSRKEQTAMFGMCAFAKLCAVRGCAVQYWGNISYCQEAHIVFFYILKIFKIVGILPFLIYL